MLLEGEFFALHETLAFSTPYSLARKFNYSIVTPHIQIALVQVINFAMAKTWQYPRISVDIATSKCFFCRGNCFVAIATTPNLRGKFPRNAVSVSTPSRHCIHTWSSLYPRQAVAVSMAVKF